MTKQNQFYGWYDDATQAATEPTYDPPHDGPCLFCGEKITEDDVRTHSLMMAGAVYAKRCYFYRTHRSCAVKYEHAPMDGFVFDLVNRNGD